MGNLLSREFFLKKEDFKIEKVVLNEESGDYVYIKQMSGYDRDLLEKSMTVEVPDGKGGTKKEVTTENFKAKLLTATLCDENGMLILKPGDFKTLNTGLTSATIEFLCKKANDLNKLPQEALNEEVKN